MKREEEEGWRHTCRGHYGRYEERGCERKTKGSIQHAFSYTLRKSNRSSEKTRAFKMITMDTLCEDKIDTVHNG